MTHEHLFFYCPCPEPTTWERITDTLHTFWRQYGELLISFGIAAVVLALVVLLVMCLCALLASITADEVERRFRPVAQPTPQFRRCRWSREESLRSWKEGYRP